jgi:hypothetical protein
MERNLDSNLVIHKHFVFNHSDWMAWKAFVSNDPSHGYDRFQIMNEQVIGFDPASDIELLASMNYGKFINQHKYSFLNWEPKDQSAVLAVY